MIVEKADRTLFQKTLLTDHIDSLDKYKYLIPRDMTIGQFSYTVRKSLKGLDPDVALWFLVENEFCSVCRFV